MTRIFTPQIGCLIKPEDLDENTSLYELYETLGIQIGCADEIIEARIASRQLKQELFISEDEPIMYRGADYLHCGQQTD